HDALLRFYGLEYDPHSKKVVRRHDFEERARNWIEPFNHNYLRITRILHCLVALGLPDRARAFFDCLRDIYAERQADIGEESFSYWEDARSEEHTSELQSPYDLVCRLLLEK